MASKDKLVYFCGECGYECGKWMGKCPACGAWNTIVPIKSMPEVRTPLAAAQPGVQRLSQVSLEESARIGTGIGEFDRVLGSGTHGVCGLVPGSVVLLGGDPGIGKSTLLMQAAAALCAAGPVLYVSGEESAAQLRLRAERLGVNADILLLIQTDLAAIEAECIKQNPRFLIIDSIQTMQCPDLPSAPGSVGQVREATNLLTRLAKSTGVTVFIVGHVTKEGAIAGPRMLEHMVDTVLYFEGDRHDAFRLLRAVKNRFGSTNELGVFEMCDTGMVEVADPSGLFLSGAAGGEPGCAVTCALEGMRPMLVEVQSLLSPSPFNNPRRQAAGFDGNRLALLLAVLEKKANLRLHDKDVYINVVGGITLNERAADLAICLCIASSLLSLPLPPQCAVLGELSLTGGVRAVSRLDKRIQECARLGFTRILAPRQESLPKLAGVEITPVGSLRDALSILGV